MILTIGTHRLGRTGYTPIPFPLPMARSPRLAHTYSVVARDPKTRQLGVAVQSHYFSVGRDVPWAEAGVGAVATQSFVDISYGPRGLLLMRDGIFAPDALARLVTADRRRDVRQVAMVDAKGRAAAHTGAKCIASAGHATGNGWSVQANMMLNDEVVPAMAATVVRSYGDLAERLVRTLDAAERAGGDIRGRQSAAILVVKGRRTSRPWEGRVLELRVEDHEDPVKELRRLLTLNRAYAHLDAMDTALARKDVAKALEEVRNARRLAPDNVEIGFWSALELAKRHRFADAIPRFRSIFRRDGRWRDLLRRLPATDVASSKDVAAILRMVDRRR